MALADELVQILRDSAQAGMDAMAEYLADEVKAEAPGEDLKANIGWFREELARIIGPVTEPLAPWWRIAELGGMIRAKNYEPYFHNLRGTAGAFLQIPLDKGSVGTPGIRILGRSGSGVKLAYDPASKTVGDVVAILKREVYHPPHKGTGYLNVVIEAKMGEAVQRFEAAMQASINGAE